MVYVSAPEPPDEPRTCNCGEDKQAPPHECPFASEIRGDYRLCTCCEECQFQCAQDI